MLFDQSAKGAGEKLPFLLSLLSYLFSGKVAREFQRKVKSEKRRVKSTKRKSRLRDFSFWHELTKKMPSYLVYSI